MKSSRSFHFYDLLLGLYPARVRREDGAAMRQLFGDLWRDAAHDSRASAQTVLWLRVLADTGRNVLIEYAAEMWRWLKGAECRLAWDKSGMTWPAVALATAAVLLGIIGKALVLRATGSPALGVSVIVVSCLLAGLILERTLRAGGRLLAASSIVVASLFLPLAWAPNAAAWLGHNPLTVYSIVWLGLSWRPQSQSRRYAWGLTGMIVATNLFSAFLIGV